MEQRLLPIHNIDISRVDIRNSSESLSTELKRTARYKFANWMLTGVESAL
jgi:hypothetical protein